MIEHILNAIYNYDLLGQISQLKGACASYPCYAGFMRGKALLQLLMCFTGYWKRANTTNLHPFDDEFTTETNHLQAESIKLESECTNSIMITREPSKTTAVSSKLDK